MKNVLSVLLIAFVYNIIHQEFLVGYFEYMGYKIRKIEDIEYFISVIFCVLPTLILRYKKTDILIFFYSIVYYLLYIPVIITTLYHNNYLDDIITKDIYYFISFLIIFLIPKLKKNDDIVIDFQEKREVDRRLVLLGIFTTILLVVYFRDRISFVSFDQVYEHRAQHTNYLSIFGYFIAWNAFLIGPLILIQSLQTKSKMLFLLGVFAIVIVYGINAGKIVLFIPLLVIMSYFVLKKKKDIFGFFSITFSSIMLFALAIEKQFFVLSAVILMRTFGMGGLLTDQYDEFFRDNPKVYYSHIGFVNYLTKMYPYPDTLGKTVSKYFDSDTESNSNANFWATDGIASLGYPGIVIISIILGLFLYQWKSATNKDNAIIMKLMLIPFSFYILNVSFFTAILSGGFLFLVMFYFLKKYKWNS